MNWQILYMYPIFLNPSEMELPEQIKRLNLTKLEHGFLNLKIVQKAR